MFRSPSVQHLLKSTPLTVYFETCNLLKIGLNNEYRIDYNVTEAPSKKNLLSAITKPFRKNDGVSIMLSEMRTVTQPTSRESLTLDFGRLRPGAYQLEVRVSALQDSNIVAGAAQSFVLVEEKRCNASLTCGNRSAVILTADKMSALPTFN
ncbi:MAG: hypothetical protein ACREOI_30165 [bacterium]